MMLPFFSGLLLLFHQVDGSMGGQCSASEVSVIMTVEATAYRSRMIAKNPGAVYRLI